MSRRDAADEDDHFVDDDGPAQGRVIICSRHPDVTYLFWRECPVCQGERNRRITDDIAAELKRFREAIAHGDSEGERQSSKQLAGLGLNRDQIQGFASAVTNRMASAPARPRACREDF